MPIIFVMQGKCLIKDISSVGVKVPNSQNPELKKLKSQNLQSTYKILNGQ